MCCVGGFLVFQLSSALTKSLAYPSQKPVAICQFHGGLSILRAVRELVAGPIKES